MSLSVPHYVHLPFFLPACLSVHVGPLTVFACVLTENLILLSAHIQYLLYVCPPHTGKKTLKGSFLPIQIEGLRIEGDCTVWGKRVVCDFGPYKWFDSGPRLWRTYYAMATEIEVFVTLVMFSQRWICRLWEAQKIKCSVLICWVTTAAHLKFTFRSLKEFYITYYHTIRWIFNFK